jgi:hypothetical protein
LNAISEILLPLTIALIVAEILSTLLVMWTGLQRRRIQQRHLAGRSMESLDDSQRQEMARNAGAEYDRTIQRKVDLLVIAYHLPALASWGAITRRSSISPLYYYGVNMLFWFVVFFVAIKVISKIGGP